MVDSESDFGLIPDKWEVKKVKDLVNRFKPRNFYVKDDVLDYWKIPVIDQSTDKFLWFHNNVPDYEASTSNPFIVFWDHTCKMWIQTVPFSVWPNVVVFNGIKKNTTYMYYLARSLIKIQAYKRHWNDLIAKTVIVSDDKTIEKFVANVSKLLDWIEKLQEQNENLKKTRDILLPKLISGEVEI